MCLSKFCEILTILYDKFKIMVFVIFARHLKDLLTKITLNMMLMVSTFWIKIRSYAIHFSLAEKWNYIHLHSPVRFLQLKFPYHLRIFNLDLILNRIVQIALMIMWWILVDSLPVIFAKSPNRQVWDASARHCIN